MYHDCTCTTQYLEALDCNAAVAKKWGTKSESSRKLGQQHELLQCAAAAESRTKCDLLSLIHYTNQLSTTACDCRLCVCNSCNMYAMPYISIALEMWQERVLTCDHNNRLAR